eukprot:311379-Chlamydomonas_euryale.AAC.9
MAGYLTATCCSATRCTTNRPTATRRLQLAVLQPDASNSLYFNPPSPTRRTSRCRPETCHAANRRPATCHAAIGRTVLQPAILSCCCLQRFGMRMEPGHHADSSALPAQPFGMRMESGGRADSSTLPAQPARDTRCAGSGARKCGLRGFDGEGPAGRRPVGVDRGCMGRGLPEEGQFGLTRAQGSVRGVSRRQCLEGQCLEGQCLEGECLEGQCFEGQCLEGECLEGECVERGSVWRGSVWRASVWSGNVSRGRRNAWHKTVKAGFRRAPDACIAIGEDGPG